MRVSVVTPTYNRPGHHAKLYAVFAAQTWPDKELLVFDDSPTPSPFFLSLNDERVRYHHGANRTKVGQKRNWLATQATGEILAHFDDDDYYAPAYLETMVAHLGDAEFVKLSAFYAYSVTHQVFTYWDAEKVARWHFKLESGRPIETVLTAERSAPDLAAWTLKNLLGYGFSFVYRKSTHQRTAFADINHGEDAQFVDTLHKTGRKVRFVADRDGIALVVRHEHDHSVICPQFLLPPHLLAKILGPGAAAYVATPP